MLDGLNEGWIDFSEHGRSAMKGATALESVIAELIRAAIPKHPSDAAFVMACRLLATQ
ncbi:hypothetical protein RRH01S_18_00830 [Rhizobium rhizogenes NBRC 13257]|uniref:Uncharacterized protein n=2 Tax=Rhizobium rhizogenes TaxID=359 RepID=A0AA87Q654_RHIRH|nr:hypothetical protein RRH01S_18_00830 [Rhizobium rhizogenes NBRC 13257]